MSLPTQIECEEAFIKAEQDLKRALAPGGGIFETTPDGALMFDITLALTEMQKKIRVPLQDLFNRLKTALRAKLLETVGAKRQLSEPEKDNVFSTVVDTIGAEVIATAWLVQNDLSGIQFETAKIFVKTWTRGSLLNLLLDQTELEKFLAEK